MGGFFIMWQKLLMTYKEHHGRDIEREIKIRVSPLCENFQLTYSPGTDYSIVTYYLNGEINVGAIIYLDHSEPCVKHKYTC